MSSFSTHLQEVKNHFDAHDSDLGNRRLIDCALDTQDRDIYRQTLQYFDVVAQSGSEIQSQQVTVLLEKIDRASRELPLSEPRSILEAKGVHKQYRQSATAFGLKPTTLSLKTGDIIGLVGENGNGKTTLLRMLAKELKPDGGELSYHIKNAVSDYDLRTRLIYVEQRIPRWYGTLMDNLQFTLATYGVKGEDNLLLVEMMIARLGLRKFRQMSWKSISSGYRTRFEIARALLRRPEVLLLDEPLANLDIISQQTILQDLKYMSGSLHAPFGMILSSQHIYEVEKVSDSIIFLKNGAPQYQFQTGASINEAGHNTNTVIFEIETTWSRDQMQQAFATFDMEKMAFNGGVYTIHFPPGTAGENIFETIAEQKIPVKYLRDISQSSRRFFNN